VDDTRALTIVDSDPRAIGTRTQDSRPVWSVDLAIAEWLAQKENRTHSQRTLDGYRDTMNAFRQFLALGGLDLLSNPIDIARLAGLWAAQRNGASRRPSEDVSPSTYNLRLAILSSWYTFCQRQYKLDITNPIGDVKKRPVQAYAAAEPLVPETVETGLESINRNTIEGMRDYALLAVGIATGRRASELAGLRGRDVKLQGRGQAARVHLTFHCKGAKVMHDLLDPDVSAVMLDYLHAQHGKQLLTLPADAPIWVSYSRQNRGQPIGAKTLSHICERYMNTSKVHALRHTFSDGMMESGAPITDLAARLGHTDIKITQAYTEKLRSADNPYAGRLTRRYGIKRKKATR
jgi:site-specific recombinase XerD